MPCYLIIDAVVYDREKFRDYAIATGELVTQFGGRYLVQGGGAMQRLEGAGFLGKAVVSEWPTREAALAFWNSPEYAATKRLRDGICDASITLVEGVTHA
jgi:uncharacterized protein (DUF1330 family)